MVQRGKPLAHSDTLFPLRTDFLRTKGLQKNEKNNSIEGKRVAPYWCNSSAHSCFEVTFLDKESIHGSVCACKKEGCLNRTFTVVKTVDNGLVALPVVLIHLASMY